MKFKNEFGHEIECTTEEYLTLMQKSTESQKSNTIATNIMPSYVQEKSNIVSKRYRTPNISLLEERKEKLKELLKAKEGSTVGVQQIAEAFGVICSGQFYKYVQKLAKGLHHIHCENNRYWYSEKKLTPSLNQLEDKKENQSRKRMTFISSRGNYLMRTYNKTREEAFKIASEEYANHGSIGVPATSEPLKIDESKLQSTATVKQTPTTSVTKENINDSSFPYIWPIDEKSIPYFEMLVKDTIGNGSKIAYFDVTKVCQPIARFGEGWNGRLWHEFVEQFLRNAHHVAAYFSVPNKFKYEKMGNYEYIIYVK